MGGHAGCRNDGAEAILSCAQGKHTGLLGGTVGGIHVGLVGNAQGIQGIHGFAQDGQIAVAAHNNTDFFHGNLLKNIKMGVFAP